LRQMRKQMGMPAPPETATAPPADDRWATMAPQPASDAAASGGLAPAGYDVLSGLRRRGLGVVYKARQRALERAGAVNLVLAGGHAGEEERVRVLAEAEAIARVKHPGIVQVYDYGTHDGLPYFSLELCAGGSLAGKLRDGPMPPRDAARMVEQIARAVQAAHE